MSYGFNVRIHKGKIVNTETFGDLPDGQIAVNGHEDEWAKSIQVSRHDGDGLHVVGAQAFLPVKPYPVAMLSVPGEASETPPELKLG